MSEKEMGCTERRRLTLGQLGLSSARLAQDGRAGSTLNDGRGVREDGGDLETTRALIELKRRAIDTGSAKLAPALRTRSLDLIGPHLDVHEERPGGLDELLELVLSELGLGGGVEEVNSESLRGLDERMVVN
jgi:hypothetical protein